MFFLLYILFERIKIDIKFVFSYPASPNIMTFKRYFFLVLISLEYKIIIYYKCLLNN